MKHKTLPGLPLIVLLTLVCIQTALCVSADWLERTDEIVFACRQEGSDGHWYANFGYFAEDENKKAYGAQGRLMVLNLRTGETRTLVEDVEGTVRDPQVSGSGGVREQVPRQHIAAGIAPPRSRQ